MGMNIKDPQVHAMARELAKHRGTSVTDAVRQALRAELDRCRTAAPGQQEAGTPFSCRQPGVQLAEPEHDGWEVFHHLLRGAELPARLCSDAYLAALAIANGWRLVSFDRDFEHFEGLERLLLP